MKMSTTTATKKMLLLKQHEFIFNLSLNNINLLFFLGEVPFIARMAWEAIIV